MVKDRQHKMHYCWWCLEPVKVSFDCNDLTDKVYCSQPCKWAEYYFTAFMADEEVEMREWFKGGKK